MVVGTNRGNFLLMHMLKYRFPNIFKAEQLTYAQEILNKTIDHCESIEVMFKANLTNFSLPSTLGDDQRSLSLLISYASEHGAAYPLKIGEDYTAAQRNSMVKYLIKSHFYDFKSSHCTPLPKDFFKNGWSIPSEKDFVLT